MAVHGLVTRVYLTPRGQRAVVVLSHGNGAGEVRSRVGGSY